MRKKRKEKENKKINRNVLIGFFIFLLVFAFLAYFVLEKELGGRTILIEKAKPATRIEGVFELVLQKGVCIPSNSIVTFNFMGVQKKTTFANFVKLGKASMREYYANFYVPGTPIRGIGRCFGVPGVFLSGSFQKVYGFGEQYLSGQYSVVFNLSAFNLYVPANVSGIYPLEITIEYAGVIIYAETTNVNIGTGISEETVPTPAPLGKLLEVPLGQGEGVIITSDFEQGNLINVSYVGNGIYRAQINMSNFSLNPDTPARYQWWFYFKASNCSGKNFVVNITDLLDEDVWNINGSLGNRWQSVWPVYSFDNNETWLRLNPLELNSTNYFKFYNVSGNNSYFIINITPSTCPIWIAALHPYPLTKSLNFINTIATKYTSYVNVTTIGYSEGNRTIKMVTITDKNYDDSGKKKILIFSGQHASGESQGSYALEGMMSYLLSNEPLAAQIRRNTIFKIVHLANPDSAALGIPRFNIRDEDLNREWNQPSPGTYGDYRDMAQEVAAIKQIRISWLPDLLLDLHGSINDDVNYFIYPSNTNTTYQQQLNNLMNNISRYPNGSVRWPEYNASYRLATSLAGSAIKNAYDENRTLALIIEFAPNCIDGGSRPEGRGNITTCFNHYIRNQNDWRNDGKLIIEGAYSYLCSDGTCTNPNLPPVITVFVPQNTTYYTKDLTFEIKTNEIASSCWYNLDNSVNVTMDQDLEDLYKWVKNVSLSFGQHNVIFYCNDSESAIGNSSRIYFTIAPTSQITNCTNISVPGSYILVNDIINSQESICINIMSNDVIFDGNGHMIDGISSGYGIYLDGTINVTVKNAIVTDWDYGIYAYKSSNTNLNNNTVNNNSYYGIYLYEALSNHITNNTANNNQYGIFLRFSSNNTLSNNIANNNYYGIYLHNSLNNTIASSITNNNFWGIYLYGSSNNVINDSLGSNNVDGIVLSSSSNNIISNSITKNNTYGIVLSDSSNNFLANNNGSYNFNYGIYLYNSSNNNLTNNTVNRNSNYGIYLHFSSNNHLTNNTVNNNSYYGIYLYNSSNNNLINNVASFNTDGIHLRNASSNNILSNNTANNNNHGFFLSYSSNSNLTNNAAHNNKYHGIYLEFSLNNKLTNNTALNNSRGFYLNNSSSNILINNTATNNDHGIVLFFSLSNNLTNNKANSNSYYGIYLYNSSNSNLSNNIASNNSYYGILLISSLNNVLINNVATYNGYNGIYLYNESNNNKLINNIASSNNYYGIFLESSSNNNLTNNLVVNNSRGIFLEDSLNNNLTNNIAHSNTYGIYLHSSSNNIITNNTAYNNSIADLGSVGTSVGNSFINQTIAGPGFSYETKISFSYGGEIFIKAIATVPGVPPNYNSINKFVNVTSQTTGTWLFLNISYNTSDLGNVNETTLRIWKHNGTWQPPNGWAYPNNVDTTNKVVYANITSFSVFAPLGQITVDNPPKYYHNFTNSTYAGQAVKHSLKWEDDVALSGYIFSFDNCTGVLVNDTFVPFSGRTNWSNVTKIINSTVGCVIRWCVYANDSANQWNSSCAVPFSYITTLVPNLIILLEEPQNNSIIKKSTFPTSQNFTWKVINFVNVNSTCSLKINNTIVGSFNCVNNTACTGTGTGLNEGYYRWQVNCSDNNGNNATSDLFGFTLQKETDSGGGGGGAGGAGGGGGGGAGGDADFCGDSICGASENQTTCCVDCGCPSGYQCIDNNCQQVLGYCGDGVCQSNEIQTCCVDCGCPKNYVCIENVCQPISVCGNNICETGETLVNCMQDCFAVYCGNQVCDVEVGENSNNCCRDCGCPENKICKNNRCISKKEINFLIIFLIILFAVAAMITISILIRIKKAKERGRRFHLKALMPEEAKVSGFKFE